MPDHQVSLEDKYTQNSGRVFITGTQALVRLPMVQVQRDRAAGLHTAGFISGYRGSPLGGYDFALELASERLKDHNIRFQPGVNEDLAATAVWGSQQLGLYPGAQYDGVTGIWYGKGPGVDRCGDVFRHANAAGTSKYGGVLALAGDDHGAKSSTVPHQSDHGFMAAVIPMLYPSSVHEFIEYGLLGIAMSRYSGCWVGMKVISETVETTAAIDLDKEQHEFILPDDFDMPKDGLNLRWPDDRWTQDHRLQNYKGYAAVAFARANKVDRITFESSHPRFGIVSSGKAYEDVRQALRELEIDEEVADRIGLRVYKVGMPWPLEPEGIRHFAEGLDEVLVVEERREVIEHQIKQQLFNWRADVRPRIVGKFDHEGHHVLPLDHELTAGMVARVIADRLAHFDLDESLRKRIETRLEYFQHRQMVRENHVPAANRQPYFCSGCPHNTSTRVPEGSMAAAGIGCHFMALSMDRNTRTFTHMGGEGASWVGLAPFTKDKHLFVNLGDGTYFHSGMLAIRQAVASGVNVTYKILYNDAVAMTGGQSVDGPLSPAQISHQLRAEAVGAIYLLSEDPDKYKSGDLASGTIVRHRDAIDQTMLEMRELPGCSILIFEQTCAAEKRRRRKRGKLVDPPKRVFINQDVCEGCGDCSVQSNCVSVEPLETALGRKRVINQSSCNKDYSCVKGFCPSFVTVEGGNLRKRSTPGLNLDGLEIPAPASSNTLDKPYNIAITGVGGTGVLTIGAIIGMAAHIEGKGCMILDVSGLAQKGGAVISQVRLANNPGAITTPRIVSGSANLLIAADSVVAASNDGAALCSSENTRAVVNTHTTPVADFVRHRDLNFHQGGVLEQIRQAVTGDESFLDFTNAALNNVGDSIATNIMMLGYACQKGLVPVSPESIEQAITINGVAIASNQKAFTLGRLMAHDPDALVVGSSSDKNEETAPAEMSLNDLIEHRSNLLTSYQGKRLAKRYRKLVEIAIAVEENISGTDELSRAVAQSYAKLLAYKDEYEVARLYTSGEFERRIAEQFEGDYTVKLSLAPPLFSRPDPNTGRPRKSSFGPWMLKAMKPLAAMKILRGTPLDPFGWHADRKEERRLISDYENLIKALATELNEHNHSVAVELAALPLDIRGFGPVKAASIAAVDKRKAELTVLFNNPPQPIVLAVAS